jgi:hypothetical protein
MANIKAKVRSNQGRIVAQTLKSGSIGLADLTDVNFTQLGEGAMLIYNATTSQFDVKPEIANASTTMNGGTY